MVKSTRSSQKAKDEENNNGRVTRSSEKAKIKAHLNVSDTAGIRKSSREKPSKMIATSSSTQKSVQVEKGTLPAPEARRKSVRVEKMKTPSPLTRSGKTRNHSFSGPSYSKSAGSLGSISRQKLQKEKSVKQLTFEAKEVNENEEHNEESSQVKIKKMTALTYRSLFIQPKKDFLGNSDNISKSNQEGDNSSGAKIDELSKGSCSDGKEVSQNGTLPSEDATAKETTVDSRIGDKRCQSKGDNSSEVKIDELSKGSCSDDEMVSKNGTIPFEDAKAKETRVDSRTDEPRCQSKGDNSIGAKIDELSKGSCSDDKEVSKNGTLPSEDATAKETTVDSRIGDKRCQSKGDNSSGAKIDELSKGSCSDNEKVSKNGTLPFEDAEAKETRVDSRTDEPRCQSKGDNSIGAKIDELSKGSCADNKEVSKHGTLTSEDAKPKETKVDSRLSGPMTDLAKNCVTPGSFIPSNTPTYETSVVSRRVQPDCCVEETLPTLVLGDSVLDDDDLVSNNAGLGGGEKLAPSKRKAITVDMDSNVPSSLSKGDSSNLIPDALPSKLGGNESCSKRIRLDYNPTVKESRDPCGTEDIDVIEATMQQKNKSDHASGTGHLKDSTVEDKYIPALLDGQSVVQPKEKVSSHIANRCKSDSYKLVEYWVPVQISNVQLEQYCATLLSNASFLCSSPKIDSVGAIRDVLISIRKCCNHPYIIEESLQPLLLKGLEEVEYSSQKEKAVAYLNVGIKASGKLQLLDSMLTELRKNKLRTLILFQPIGVSGKTSIVDILDDFLRQRFGEDSYERIDNCLTASKKQAATKIFNDKNNKRFFFLMETSACHPSIKLSSIDATIIFDSDWNPMNDIRSLQKLTLDSQFELIKTFRLYSPFTVEEKALILSRQGKTLDINCPSSSRGLSHTLLMWGAAHLFDELRVFHDSATSMSNLKPLLEETVLQFSSCLADVGEDSDTSNCSILLKVQQHGGAYLANSPLFGELEFRLPDEELPQTFWKKLLEERQFPIPWKYSCGSSQRSRRRVQPFNNLAGGTDLVKEGTAKKRLKVSNNNVDQPSSKSVGEKLPNGIKAGTFGDLVDKLQGNDVESEKNGRVHDELRSLHLSLKPQITKLCEVLLLPDNVRNVVDKFLEYVTNKHHFNWESVSIQSFQISLISAAASLLKHKVDHKTSLALAKAHLNFDCKQAEVDYSCSFLQCLKKIFVYRTGTYNDNSSPKASKSLNGVSCTEVVREVELFKKDLSKSIKKIEKKFVKMLNKVRLMYQEEKHMLRMVNEDEKAELERKYKIQLAMTRSCSPNEVVRTESLNILNVDHQKRIEELKCQYETSLKELDDEHSEHIQKYQVWEASWVEEVKSWGKNELLNIVASKGPGAGIDYSQMCDNVVDSMIEAGAMVTETNSLSVGKTVEQQNSLVKHDRANEMDILVPNDQPISGSEDHNMTENQYVSQEKIISKHSHSREQNSDGATSMTDETNRSENFGLEFRDGCERSSLGTTSLPDYENATHREHRCSDGVSSGVEGQIPVEVQETTDKGESVSVSERQVQVEMPATDNFTDCQLQNATQLNPPSSMDQISDRVSIDVPVVDGVLSSKPCQAVGLTSCQDKISLSNLPLEQQIPDGDVPVMEPENSHAVAECHMEPSSNAMLVDNSTSDDQEGGVHGTVTSAPVPRPVNVMEPLGQGKELPSVKSAADKNSDGAMQNSSEQGQVASSSADVVPANQITVPSKQVHQLAAAEPSSNLAMPGLSNVHLATEDEHQLNSAHSLPTHHSEPSSVVPNKDVGQSHSNSALSLHSNQVAVHPISNSDLDSRTAGRVRAQSGYRRNLSNPLEMNNHPIQSTPPSSSRRLQHLSYDPLNIEFERIQKVIEQSSKNHEDTKLRLKSDFEKELAELRRKYDVKFQEIEVEFQQTKKTLDTNLNTVYVNKILANAFKSKCLDLKVSGASGVLHDSLPQQLHQLSRQQAATRPFLVSGSSSGESPATSLPSPSIAPTSQHMLPPGYNMSGTFSSTSARPPLINTTRSSIARDIQGGEIRAPAPHLHSSRPSISAPPSSFNPLQRGIPSQIAPSNLRATSPSYSHVSPCQRPPSYQSDPQMGRRPGRPGSAGRSALLGYFSSQSTKTPPNIISHLSDVAPANLSKFGPNSSSVVANSSHQATSQNLVCLSDDE